MAGTVGSALNFMSGGLEVVHRMVFFFFFFEGNTSINLRMYTKIIPHIITAVWLAQLAVSWASVGEVPGSNHGNDNAKPIEETSQLIQVVVRQTSLVHMTEVTTHDLWRKKRKVSINM